MTKTPEQPEDKNESGKSPSTTIARARVLARRLLSRGDSRREQQTESVQKVFAHGQRVAERYVINQFIAQGGAGQVYRAQDLELGGVVALKTLHPKFLQSELRVEQFRREVQLARSVTHQHVCRLFDIAYHPPSGENRVLFATMAWLDGPTLSQALHRDGRIEIPRALRLAGQIADGAAAAHRQGIVHRDLKGSNVILVERDGRECAIVTDFGLALPSASGPPSPQHDGARIEGTPLYMAPEQLAGDTLGPQADVYAIGVLLYRMLTGEWPAHGSNGVLPPSHFRSALDQRYDALVLKALAREPANRFPSARELSEAIQRLRSRHIAQSRNTRRGWAATGALLGLLAVLLGGWHYTARQAAERQVFIAGVLNASGNAELQWVSTALQQALNVYLTADEKLNLLGQDSTMGTVESTLRMAPDAPVEQPLARATQLGARWLITATYRHTSAQNGLLTVDVKLLSVADPQNTHTLSISGRADAISDLGARMAAHIRDEMGLPPLQSEQASRAQAELPADAIARRRLAEGLDALRRHEGNVAIEKLDEALARAPDHPLVHAALARAQRYTGYRQQARASAKRAFELSTGLSRERQLSIEAQYWEQQNEWRRAEDLYAALHKFYPQQLDYGLALASVQDSGARLDQASATLNALRALPGPLGRDPRINLKLAMVHWHAGEMDKGRELARTAQVSAREIGADALVAEALVLEAKLTAVLDPSIEVGKRLLPEAQKIFQRRGNKSGQAYVLRVLADEAFADGRLSDAERHTHEALALSRETGNEADTATAATKLAILHDLRGDLATGLAMKQELVANYQRRDIKLGEAVMKENIGISRFKLGDLTEAMLEFQGAEEMFRHLGDQTGIAWAPYYQGRVWLYSGEVALARPLLRLAVTASQQHKEGGLGENARFALAVADIATGQLGSAQLQVEALLDDFEANEQTLLLAETRLLHAEIHYLQSDWGSAQTAASRALAVFEKEQAHYYAASARRALVRASFADPDLRHAQLRERCQQLAESIPGLQYGYVALRAQVADAECRIAYGQWGLAREQLQAAREQALAKNQAIPAWEASQLLAQMAIARGDTQTWAHLIKQAEASELHLNGAHLEAGVTKLLARECALCVTQ